MRFSEDMLWSQEAVVGIWGDLECHSPFRHQEIVSVSKRRKGERLHQQHYVRSARCEAGRKQVPYFAQDLYPVSNPLPLS
jgi:hypothetical protein